MIISLDKSRAEEVESIIKIAFSTHMGLPDASAFNPGASFAGRFTAVPDGVFGAVVEDKLVAAIFCINWGSFGFFGPLVVLPEYWGRGIAQELLQRSDQFFIDKKVELAALYTFPNSPKHVALYQKYDYWPKQLTAMMTIAVNNSAEVSPGLISNELYSKAENKEHLLSGARSLCNGIYAGLDVTCEITTVDRCNIGDTVFITENGQVSAFAVCHFGHGSEATTNSCLIKFAAARDQSQFDRLVDGCLSFAGRAGATHLTTGVNTARHEAYNSLLKMKFSLDRLGLAMIRSDQCGFNRPGIFVLDDWR